ncbi:MAG: metallophosphoesterase [Victivallaceae bacterium]|nr:metallophosphoesterase [Victivallaceae bacterium]
MRISGLFAVLLTPLLTLGASELKLAWLTDIHVVDGNANAAMTAAAIDEINSGNADAVILSGDLTGTGSIAELRYVKTLLDRLTKPLLAVPGNHETNWSDSNCEAFPALFGGDRFCRRIGGFIIAGIPSGPWMKMGDGYVRNSDLAWLDAALKEQVRPGDRVIFVCHYPLNQELSNAQAVLAVLKKYPVAAILSGHYHNLGVLNANGFGNVIGRAISLRHSSETAGGYNLVEISGNRVSVFNKTVGAAKPDKPEIEFQPDAIPWDPVKFRPADSEPPPPELVFSGTIPEVLPPPPDESPYFKVAAGRCQAPPAVRDNVAAFGAWDTFLYVLTADTGELKWKWNNGSDNILFSPGNVTPVIGEKNLAVVAPDRYLTIFDRETGEVKLRTNQYKFRESLGPATDGKHAYAKTMDGELAVIDVDAAAVEKVIDLGLGYEHTPVPPCEAFGDVFVGGRQGDLVRVDPASGKIKWRHRCGTSGFDRIYYDGEKVTAAMIDGGVWTVIR